MASSEPPRDALAAEFDRCRPYLQAALDRDFGLIDMGDLWEMVRTGAVQFWATPNSATITAIETTPKKRVLFVRYSGGDLSEILQVEKSICTWAESQGCDQILISGRRGWLRVLDGYEEGSTVMVKQL